MSTKLPPNEQCDVLLWMHVTIITTLKKKERKRIKQFTSCNAGASFVPSPVTATTCPLFFKACTNKSLSFGEDLPIT
jgi:hypothetical protein